MRCAHYMIMFGLAISDKQGRVGQAKPGFPHFADENVKIAPLTENNWNTDTGRGWSIMYILQLKPNGTEFRKILRIYEIMNIY